MEGMFYRIVLRTNSFYSDGFIIISGNEFEGSLTQDFIKGRYKEEEKVLEITYLIYNIEYDLYLNRFNIRMSGLESFELPSKVKAKNPLNDKKVQIEFVEKITDPIIIKECKKEMKLVNDRLNRQGKDN